MTSFQLSLYPFISSSNDDFDSCAIRIENNSEPIPHMDGAGKPLIHGFQSKILTIAASQAEIANVHEDIIYDRLPIDVLIFGRSGVGKSCLLKAITNDNDIRTSAQLNHVTTKLESYTKKIGKLTFRFWDTKGIDTWSISHDVGCLLKEIKQNNIRPLFVIYCSTGSGRVNSEVVIEILKFLKGTKTPIAYVITNIYNHNDEQLREQIKGGLNIMSEVYLNNPIQKNEYYYEFNPLTDTVGNVIHDGKGILVGVNSEPYLNRLTNTDKSKLNLYELMCFIGNNLDDDDFVKYVMLTLQNRSFWEQNWDYLLTALYRCRDKLVEYGIRFREFVLHRWENSS